MKAKLACLITISLAPTLTAQEPMPVQHSPSPRVVRNPPQPQKPDPSAALTENITISLGGNFQGLVPMDLQLTGTGPTFQTDIVTKASEEDMPPIIITFRATVVPGSDGYKVDYSLGARIAVKTSVISGASGKTSYNFQYQDVALTGTVQLKADKSVTLSKVNDQELTMAIGLTESQTVK